MADRNSSYGNDSRRRFLKKVGVTTGVPVLTGIAGCSSNSDGGGSEGDGSSDGGSDSGGDGGSDTSSDELQEQSITIGSLLGPGLPVYDGIESWVKSVNEETPIYIELIPAFGSEADLLDQTESQAIDGCHLGSKWISDITPEYFWMETPFLLTEWDQTVRAWTETEWGEEAFAQLEEKSQLKAIENPLMWGMRNLSGNKAFEQPEDVDGIKLRTPLFPDYVEVWEHLGAQVTQVAWNETYGALERGVVDAQENPASITYAASMNEVQSHYTLTQHNRNTVWVMFNQDFWNNMPDANREYLHETLNSAIDEINAGAKEFEEEHIELLEEEGMTIVREPDIEAFYSAADPKLREMFENKWNGPGVDEARKI